MKKSILFYTFLSIILYLLINNLLKLQHLTFLNIVKISIYILIICTLIVGTVQLILSDEDKYIRKIIFSFLTAIIEIMIITPFVVGYLILGYRDDDIVYKYDQHFVCETFVGAESISKIYYDYCYIFKGTQRRITEVYDGRKNYLYTIYYDQNGKEKMNSR